LFFCVLSRLPVWAIIFAYACVELYINGITFVFWYDVFVGVAMMIIPPLSGYLADLEMQEEYRLNHRHDNNS
jgi:hypothetical protein